MYLPASFFLNVLTEESEQLTNCNHYLETNYNGKGFFGIKPQIHCSLMVEIG